MTNERLVALSRVIVDQIDPSNLVPGGTDTCIHDLFKYSDAETLALAGVTNNPALPLGRWVEIEFASKKILFLPLARLDRERKTGLRIPHSAQLALGLLRFRSRIPGVAVQAHRIETGAVLKTFFKNPLIQFIHNDSMGLTGSNSDSLWKRLPYLYRLMESLVFKYAKHVVLFNQTDSARIANRVKNLTVAQTWFDPEVFKPVQRRWVPGQTIEICWIGRFEAQKDPLLAMAVAADLDEIYPNFRLTVVGTGTLKSRMEAAARESGILDKIRFTGPLTREQVASLMGESTVMLLTSHYEGSPRVVAEAAATGLPIVATAEADTDGVLNGRNGQRVHGRRARDLASWVVNASGCDASSCIAAVSHRGAPNAVSELVEKSAGGA